MNKILTVICAAFLAACAEKTAVVNNNAANSNQAVISGAGNAANAAANTNANAAGVNKTTNTNADTKTADTSPKRISFNKGANWGAVNVTLAAGAAQKFVVGAKSGQTMDVEVSSKETSVNLIKGKAATTEDFGFLNAELQSNGDYVFEVKNPTKKEIKTSVKVTIEPGKTNEFGDGQGADDGDRPNSGDSKEN